MSDEFTTTKPIWQSVGVIGGVIAVISAIVGAFGYTVGTEDQAVLVGAVTAITSGVGGIVAVYGRVRATKKVK